MSSTGLRCGASAGTGLRRYRGIVVGSKKELEVLQAAVSGTARTPAGDGSTTVEAEL